MKLLWPGKPEPSPTHTVSALGADRLADLDALDVVLDRLRAGCRVGVAERSILVGVAWPGASEKVLEFIASKPRPS